MDAFESNAPLGCVALDLLPNALSLLQVGLVTSACWVLFGWDAAGYGACGCADVCVCSCFEVRWHCLAGHVLHLGN